MTIANETTFGATASQWCNEGYDLTGGNTTIYCQPNGAWSRSVTCTVKGMELKLITDILVIIHLYCKMRRAGSYGQRGVLSGFTTNKNLQSSFKAIEHFQKNEHTWTFRLLKPQ